MKNILRNLIILSAVLLFASCEKQPVGGNDPDNGTNQTLELMISLPEKIEGAAGDAISVKYYSGKGPKTGDVVVLKKSGKEVICNIVSIEPDSFSFEISPEVETGKYSFCIRRGEMTKAVKDVQFNIEIRVEVAEKEGYNIYGIITCDEAGVPGVVVSDGIETAVTDEDGIYYLKSQEYNRLVFMSVPSGYETVADGVVPKFHKVIDGNPSTVERVDWTLAKVDNEDHIMYVLGDMHLANRTNDLNQFAAFTSDLKSQITANKDKKQYALTLGDMSWDLYWYDNAYDLYSYVETINSSLSGIQIFHTIGNHDHDMNSVGDFNTVTAFKNSVAPTYYSFNIGNIHYIVLDNILCTNNGTGNRTYDSSLTQDQLTWLANDLKHVDKSKKLVVTMHAQMYNENGKSSMAFASELEKLCSGYETHVLSAHTHVIWNNDNLATKGIFHHNSGAICGTWWWTGSYTPGLGLCKDGSPSGYYVYNMNGTDIKWRLKPTGRDFSKSFRTYDRNEIVLTAARFAPKANSDNAAKFESSASYWVSPDDRNYVYFNVFDYDPSWKIEVTENGSPLKYEVVKVKDPLHLAAYEAMRYNDNKIPTSSFNAYTVASHFFRVQASSKTSTLEFRITDRFGNVYTETMKRPKAFSLAAYNR